MRPQLCLCSFLWFEMLAEGGRALMRLRVTADSGCGTSLSVTHRSQASIRSLPSHYRHTQLLQRAPALNEQPPHTRVHLTRSQPPQAGGLALLRALRWLLTSHLAADSEDDAVCSSGEAEPPLRGGDLDPCSSVRFVPAESPCVGGRGLRDGQPGDDARDVCYCATLV